MPRRDRYRSYGYFPPSRPRETVGGIKAKSRRGTFAKNWWAKRWVEVLESYNIGARLTRGRRYARAGQVTEIEVGVGQVTAEVQGSRARPYQVTMGVKCLTTNAWEAVAQRLTEEPLFLGQLLTGEMPHEIERAFAGAEVLLFPIKHELTTDCSCPDWSNPCKHIAAVYYLLGEEFDRDPFLIFRMRGMSRDGLLDLLDGVEAAISSEEELAVGSIEANTDDAQSPRCDAEPLPHEPNDFWSVPTLPTDSAGSLHLGGALAALPHRLGQFPFWRGHEDFIEAMDRVYSDAMKAGVKLIGGE